MAKEIQENLISLCKRRGFIFQTSEIYGGLQSFYDYGPLGVALKRNIKKLWWKEMVQKHAEIVGLDSSILMHPKTWQASGHLKSFTDPLVECRACHKRFKADELDSDKCPDCQGELTESKDFNLMFKTFMGSTKDTASEVYLRPETAQGIFVNFKNILQSTRLSLPFGIAQIGKAFRNEITSGNFIFRIKEFEQMELEYFVNPKNADKIHKEWQKKRLDWYIDLGINKKNIRLEKHSKDELAHYAKACSDVEYKFPFGWSEIEGIANRQDFDLVQHSKYSQKDLIYQDPQTNEKFTPYIIEPSAGVERPLFAFLMDAYHEVGGGRGKGSNKKKEIVLRLDKRLSPIKVAIFPLIKKKPLQKLAREIFNDLKNIWMCQYDETGSIGKRYRRQDEVGTPYCITVDFDSLDDKSVTIRDRDTMEQDRIKINELESYLRENLGF